MPQPLTQEHFDQTMLGMTKSLDELKHSLTATDAVVTALYAELVQTRPNIRDRLHTLETNLAKVINITPGAGELRQPIYDAGDVA